MPDSKRPSGPGQLKNAQRADATTQEEIDETIEERAAGSDEAQALDPQRDAKRGARDANVTPRSPAPSSSRGGSGNPDRS